MQFDCDSLHSPHNDEISSRISDLFMAAQAFDLSIYAPRGSTYHTQTSKHTTLHQMSVICDCIIMLSTLHVCKNIIIKVMRTSHNQTWHEHLNLHQHEINTDNDIYTMMLDSKSHIYMSKEWVSTKMSATRAQSIKMVQKVLAHQLIHSQRSKWTQVQSI